VDIARDGRYLLEMRRYPREASKAIGATGAEVKIGMARASKPIDIADKKAILEMDLDAGQYDMQTFFRDDTDSLASWGAYYVYVQYLD
jgi:hypothetical protein